MTTSLLQEEAQPLCSGLRRVDYCGLALWTGPPEAAACWMVDQACSAGRDPTVVSHVNANNYYWLHRRPDLRAALQEHAMLLLDGVGLQIGARWLGLGRLPDLNGTDLFPLVLQGLAVRHARVYLLGGRPAVVEGAARRIEAGFPGVRVVGWHHGYFGLAEQPARVREIRGAAPQALLVGCGFGRQEEFALQHRQELHAPLLWNVGGLFDFVSGARRRAPAALRRARLEWFFRLLVQPRAMWHRNLVAAPWFLADVLVHRTGWEREPGS